MKCFGRVVEDDEQMLVYLRKASLISSILKFSDQVLHLQDPSESTDTCLRSSKEGDSSDILHHFLPHPRTNTIIRAGL